MEKAFDYRGDVTITLQRRFEAVEGYIFDRKHWFQRLLTRMFASFPKDAQRRSAPMAYSDDRRTEAFTGKDRAAGASWEAWVKKWNEKKAAGEKGFGLHPESLE